MVRGVALIYFKRLHCHPESMCEKPSEMPFFTAPDGLLTHTLRYSEGSSWRARASSIRERALTFDARSFGVPQDDIAAL